MTNNIMFDIAIGLAMLYLLGALFCTILQEWIASVFKLRARNLRDAIGYLVEGKTDGASSKTLEVLNHPLLRIASDSSGKLLDKAPSYVSTRNFTISLVHALDLKVTDGKIDPAAVRAQVEALPPQLAEAKKALLAMLDTAGTEGAKMLASMDAWYDATMDRASGWYKRRAQGILLVIGFILSAGMGADTLAVAQRLSQDHALRASFMALAASTAAQDAKADSIHKVKTQLSDAILAQMGGKPASGLIGNLPFSPTDWNAAWAESGCQGVIAKLIGCLLTGLALALGAPFWFGLLQQLNAIRSSGPKPPTAAQANA